MISRRTFNVMAASGAVSAMTSQFSRAEDVCRFQYSVSFISALMSREGNKQLPTRHPSGQKLNFRSLCGFRTPRMATSTIDRTHACDNHF
jgi:hypothetical protein